ncbi:MAG TPA: cytochrome b [Gammaproteobacteria bacterium]|nr:cytochrome b [Gammaproteobacteria bacterium]
MIIPLRNDGERYGAVAQLLHWTVVALVIVQFVLGVTAHGLPISLERLQLLARHKSFGMTLFAIVILRLLWRLYSPAPPLPGGMSRLQTLAAHLSHILLYGLLLVMPVVGWISSSASHLTVSWFGLFAFPDLVGPDPQLARIAKQVHMDMAWMLFALACLHVLAACWHQWWRQDDALLRMLPFRRS